VRSAAGHSSRVAGDVDLMDENSFGQKLLAEVLGTGFLVFIGVGSVPATLLLNGNGSAHPFTMADLGIISFAFALIVIAMVYALGHISGCHINPAVTVALAVTKKFPWNKVPAYIAAQLVGATLGALAILGTLGWVAGKELGLGVAAFHPGVGYSQATFAEFIGTFLLVFTVFGVIDRRAPAGWAGLAIGFVVFAAIIVVAPATSASINPARTFGPMAILQAVGGTVHWSQIWGYLGGEFAGGIAAGLAYTALAATRTRSAQDIELTLTEATTDVVRA
jgi:glycerol uptake facilitator protein